MKLNLEGIKERAAWEAAGVSLPAYDVAKVAEETKKAPTWVHFGIGNIFRIFIGGLADTLLNEGETDKGITCVETFDFDVVDKIYAPYDNLALCVTLKEDGTTKKRIVGSLTEAIKAQSSDNAAWTRLKDIFTDAGLQLCSFTITEKGYALRGSDGSYFPFIVSDIENGPEKPTSAMAVVTALLYARFQAGKHPIAVVSMDNCSHNGEKLSASVVTMAKEWEKKGFVPAEFIEYLTDEKAVSFPWSMIDKITPRPAESVEKELAAAGVEDMAPVITSKKTYIAPFVNAEGPQYLVIEDKFPNGRPPLEKAGVYMTDRDTVNKVERMKVTTCLNPLHTALAVYGCLLGYTLIADEMKDPQLKACAAHRRGRGHARRDGSRHSFSDGLLKRGRGRAYSESLHARHAAAYRDGHLAKGRYPLRRDDQGVYGKIRRRQKAGRYPVGDCGLASLSSCGGR